MNLRTRAKINLGWPITAVMNHGFMPVPPVLTEFACTQKTQLNLLNLVIFLSVYK